MRSKIKKKFITKPTIRSEQDFIKHKIRLDSIFYDEKVLDEGEEDEGEEARMTMRKMLSRKSKTMTMNKEKDDEEEDASTPGVGASGAEAVPQRRRCDCGQMAVTTPPV